MNVSEAVALRSSVRAFRDSPVPEGVVRDLLTTAARAPSGGNLQPWHVHAVTGTRLRDVLKLVEESGPDPAPGYAVYPAGLADPYRTRRFQVGEELYSTLGIARGDKEGRLTQFARNARFFDAPVGLFVFVHRGMGPPQWADLGMYMQTLMLLATERGLGTCAQEYWSLYSATVERFLAVPEDQMLFCGIALGERDPDAPVNSLRTRRADEQEWCSLHGFGGGDAPSKENDA